MSTRKPISVPWIGVAALRLSGYLGAYYAMAHRFEVDSVRPLYGPSREQALDGWENITSRSSTLELTFHPADFLDRRVRPHIREPTQ